MIVEARPSVFHWIIASFAGLAILVVAWVPVLFVTARFFPPEQRLSASCLGLIPVGLLVLPFVIRSGHAAHWSVDFEGLSSPAVGRISFSEVVSLHLGYPPIEALSLTAFKSIVGPGVRPMIDRTLVLRLNDGRLLPLNLVSPTVQGGAAVMTKVLELLSGKAQSNVVFSQAEITALKGRPMNRFVVPKYP